MKKFACLMLILTLLTGCAAAQADVGLFKPLIDKLQLQLSAGSGLKGTISLSAQGAPKAAQLAALWPILNTMKAEFTYVSRQREGKEEGKLRLSANGGDMLDALNLLRSGDQVYASGALLPESFSIARDAGALPALLNGGSGAWPSLLRPLLAIQGADAAWKSRAETILAPYLNKMTVWLTGFSTYKTDRDEAGVLTSTSVITIPAQAFVAQLKQMLIDLYADDTALNLLREVFTAAESAAYLEKGMQNAFFNALNNLDLQGDIGAQRVYDAEGTLLRETVSLPFAASAPLRSLTLESAYDAGGDTLTVNALLSDNRLVMFTLSGGANESGSEILYSGSLRYSVPKESFTVGEAEYDVTSFKYGLLLVPGVDAYDQATNICSRSIQCSLDVIPDDEAISPFSATLTLDMASGASNSSAVRINALLKYAQVDTGCSLAASIEARTAAPFAIADPVVKDYTALDEMTGEELKTWLDSFTQKLTVTLTNLLTNWLVTGEAEVG